MRASPDFAPARSRFGAVLISLVVIGAGCGGDGSTTEPAATEPPAATAATAEPATSEPTPSEPTPTEPTTTEPTTAVGFPGEGEWTAYYRVSENDGWWASPDVAFTFPVEFECEDATCSTGTRVANPDGDAVSTPFTFDGDIFSTQIDRMEACLSPATGVADGPMLTATTAIDTLASVLDGPEVTAFVGVRNFAAVTVGSAECAAEELGYIADVVYARDDAGTPATITADGWFRAGSGEATVERAVRLCTATPCDLQYRMPKQMLVADGSSQSVFVDVLLTQGADGTYTGSATWLDSCASDNDGSFVAAAGYDTTVTVTVTAVEVGDQVIIRASEAQFGTPHESLTPEQAAICTAYEIEDAVHGIRLPDTAVELTSWTEAPINE